METITIHIPDWFLILITVWLGIEAAESTLKLISWGLSKKLENEEKKTLDWLSKRSGVQENHNQAVKNIRQHEAERRYEAEVLNPIAEYKVKLMFWDDRNGICIPPERYMEDSPQSYNIWDAEQSLYFSEDEAANERNRRRYIENRVQALVGNTDLKFPLIYEEE